MKTGKGQQKGKIRKGHFLVGGPRAFSGGAIRRAGGALAPPAITLK